MTGAAEDALLDDPWIRAHLEHVEIVIGFENQTVGVAQMDLDELGHVTEVGDDRELGAIGAEGKGDRVGGIVGYGERVDINVADCETLTSVNGFEAMETLAERVGKNAVHRIHGGLGDVEWGLPKAEHLRQAVAVVGVLVRDEDPVKAVDALFNSGKARERFAFPQAGVHEEAGALGLEQGDVARAARRQNGYPQADRLPPNSRKNSQA